MYIYPDCSSSRARTTTVLLKERDKAKNNKHKDYRGLSLVYSGYSSLVSGNPC